MNYRGPYRVRIEEFEHNKAGLLKKVAIGAAVIGLIGLITAPKSRDRHLPAGPDGEA